MKWVNADNRIPIKSWCRDIEDGAYEQLHNLANLPFALIHIAVMPDCHQGYGMPIGGVLVTENVVIPNAVGVDIGCGMGAVKTNLTELSTERLKEIMTLMRKKIPVGFDHQSDQQEEELMPKVDGFDIEKDSIGTENIYPIVIQQYNSALKQLGTLGGGNHFIEIQKGSDGYIWIMVHSGSRNIGYTVAKHYNKLAQELHEKWFTQVPKKWGLAFFPLDSKEGKAYLREMNYCLEFAKCNRDLMLKRIKRSFSEIPCNECKGRGGSKGKKCELCKGAGIKDEGYKVRFEDTINIHHNYAIMEHHFGKNVMVHRKGATLAREGIIGIIPGSQGTSSYIVKGKGNIESFNSCSHGAGRLMSRTRAQNQLSLKAEQKKLEDKGILHTVRHKNDLDESPGSYKDIEEVMKSQEDLVEILVKLEPLGVIKG